MKQFAVIGNPIKHSKSPVMHNAAFKHLNIDAEYSKLKVTVEELQEFTDKARKELAGFNITVPHKYEIIPYLDDITELAKVSGSVNTVINRDGKLIGDTTDGYGLATGIKEAFNIGIKDEVITFIGAGGAVKAAATYFASLNAKKIFIVNRTVQKAESIKNNIVDNFSTEVEVTDLNNISKIEEFIGASKVLIQGTSLGLSEADPTPIPLEVINKDIAIYDSIYKETPILKYAKDNGNLYADGRSMLLYQGAKAFSIWTGCDAPVDIMRDALYSTF
jgi:shikimate dehydrogenase